MPSPGGRAPSPQSRARLTSLLAGFAALSPRHASGERGPAPAPHGRRSPGSQSERRRRPVRNPPGASRTGETQPPPRGLACSGQPGVASAPDGHMVRRRRDSDSLRFRGSHSHPTTPPAAPPLAAHEARSYASHARHAWRAPSQQSAEPRVPRTRTPHAWPHAAP